MTKRVPRRVRAVPCASAERTLVPTVVEFLLDETGSMDQSATIAGYNDFLREQRAQPGTCLLTLTKFNSLGLRTPYSDIDVGMVPDLDGRTYDPRGLTNLRDAISARLIALASRLTLWDIQPRVLLVALTDGLDNVSSEPESATRATVATALHRGWSCVYLGPKGSAPRGQHLGFPEGSIRTFAASETRTVMQDLSVATTAFRASSSSVNTFFGAMSASR